MTPPTTSSARMVETLRRLWARLHRHVCLSCDRPTIFRHDVCQAEIERELAEMEWRREDRNYEF